MDFNIDAIDNVDLVLGGFYYYDKFGTEDPDGIVVYRPGKVVAQTTHAQQWTYAWALYADATWHISDQFSLAAGGRFSHDRKRMTFNAQLPTGAFSVTPIANERSWNKFTPRLTARYEIAPRTNIWASWSRGFRSGTYNFSGPTVLGLLPVDPETADAYELGFKTAQNRVRFSTSAFYYDYRSIQTSVTIPNPLCPAGTVCNPLITLQNAKGGEIYGLEAEVTWEPIDRLSLHAGAVWSHARYKSFPNATGTGVNATNTLNISNQMQDWTGHRMVRAPDWSGNVSLDYEQPVSFGKFLFSANLNFTSEFPLQNASLYGPAAPAELRDKQRLVQNGYALLSAQLTWTDRSDRFSLTVFGNNLTDHTYFLFYNAGVFGDYMPQADPREWGVRAGYKF
jgi:iron complex outermembrane receptor protein